MSHLKIINLLKQSIGLGIDTIGKVAFEYSIRSRMSECGIEHIEDYSKYVHSSEIELQALIEAVVVPETFFFRYPESFKILSNLVMNEWLPQNPFEELKILSVPCSTGEEPYSIAIALMNSGFPEKQFKIDAVDISQRALNIAADAIYGMNSFRGSPQLNQTSYFAKINNDYRLDKAIREKVNFLKGNLLSLNSTIKEQYHIIFCRNVLIYLNPTSQKISMDHLDNLLMPNGYLFSGSGEASIIANKFKSNNHPMAFSFKKASNKPLLSTNKKYDSELQPCVHQSLQIKTGLQSKTQSAASIFSLHGAKSETRKMPETVNSKKPELQEAQLFANSGQLSKAAQICESYLQSQRYDASAYFLLGLIRDSEGDTQLAITNYRKTLYLEPNHIEALTHLVLLMEKLGGAAGAKRFKDRLERMRK